MNVKDRMLKPFVKLGVENVSKNLKANDNDSFSIGNFSVHMVWLQGVVSDVSKDGDTIELADEDCSTATVIVTQCHLVPRGLPSGIGGKYCQVLGEVLGIDSASKVRIRAVKIVDLEGQDVLRKMWPHELTELQQVQRGQLTFAA